VEKENKLKVFKFKATNPDWDKTKRDYFYWRGCWPETITPEEALAEQQKMWPHLTTVEFVGESFIEVPDEVANPFNYE
jgi:hypothetical protein